MIRFQVLTLFPELFGPFRANGLVSRALEESKIALETVHLRNFAVNAHGQVDDNPYGGGSGMVLRPESAVGAIEHAKSLDPAARVILFTPRGKPLTQEILRGLAAKSHGWILLCPRYEGVDERVVEGWVDEEFSLGDYILMGGEVPGMAFIESVTRLLPGVLNNPESIITESFEAGMIEHPQYTKPQEFRGKTVPEVLLSGHHEQIRKWRITKAEEDTRHRRPDLCHAPLKPNCDISIALLHHPVLDKQGAVITSSITNIDLHDIARSAKTYGIDNFYVAHPVRTLRRLAEKICSHWRSGFGFRYNPNRSEALDTITLVPDFDDILLSIEERTGKLPRIVTTSAKKTGDTTSYAEFRARLLVETDPHLILFGTGWGMAPEIMARAEIRLEPIVGPTKYNHLSVRSAAAITFDRLFGALRSR